MPQAQLNNKNEQTKKDLRFPVVGRTHQVSICGIGCRIACDEAETGDSSAIGIRRMPQRGAGRKAHSCPWVSEGRRMGHMPAPGHVRGGGEQGQAGPRGAEGGRSGTNLSGFTSI